MFLGVQYQEYPAWTSNGDILNGATLLRYFPFRCTTNYAYHVFRFQVLVSCAANRWKSKPIVGVPFAIASAFA